MIADAVKNGVRPTRGMWLISPSRRRAYGPIRSVRSDVIVWVDAGGALVKTSHETIHHGDYTYAAERPEGFAILEALR